MNDAPGGLTSVLLSPLSGVYGRVVAHRNRAFDAGRGVVRLEEPVISVGNLSVGGTGKTPVCRYVVSVLRNAGKTPAIAMRGYKANARGESDEAMEYASAFEDLPLAVGADRVAALAELRSKTPFDCVVLDDGFQHRRIARDLDIVLIDATRPGLDGKLLPAGRLREPTSSLMRADAVLVTRATKVDSALARRIEKCAGAPPVAWLEHVWSDGIDVHSFDGSSKHIAVQELAGIPLAVSLGVGNPASIRTSIESLGARIVHEEPARDHQAYSDERIVGMFAKARKHGAEGVLVTPKDWMKLRDKTSSFDKKISIFVPRLEMKVLEGAAAMEDMILRAATLGS